MFGLADLVRWLYFQLCTFSLVSAEPRVLCYDGLSNGCPNLLFYYRNRKSQPFAAKIQTEAVRRPFTNVYVSVKLYGGITSFLKTFLFCTLS